MNPFDFDTLADFLKRSSGMLLTRDKEYLVETRLKPVAQSLGLTNVAQVISKLRLEATDALKQAVIEAMTINETLFFRDISPFEIFRNHVLTQLMERRSSRKEIRIWCAASSSGQEPYSLAMLLCEEAARLAGWRVSIVATDIDTTMLRRAERGIYSEFEVQRGLPARYLIKYFSKRLEGDWVISDSIRSMIQFKQLNLLSSFASLGPCDLVMCRNVLIYFDEGTKRQILDKIGQTLRPDGFLMLGCAELVFNASDRFAAIPGQRALYAPSEPKTLSSSQHIGSPRLAMA